MAAGLSSCTNNFDFQLLSVGSILGFLSAAEFGLAVKGHKEMFPTIETNSQIALRMWGTIAALVGSLVAVWGFVQMSSISAGCSVLVCFSLSAWNSFSPRLFGGLGVVVSGVTLILVSRFLMKIQPVTCATPKLFAS
ncbi:MAG TPA: hypothetical protein VFF30_20280 [Nitrososphaerales archaeon]|nr:hypothetical protein [Nitrososphaerales archaeon]